MRPDLDEYEELNPELGEPRSRAMSWLVLGVAVIGFGALAYYAYQSGSKSIGDGQMLVVEAEPGAIKEAPVDAGGEQFPHKDKTIYDALSPYRTDEKVETLLPTAEEPVIPEPAVGDGAAMPKSEETTSFVNEDAAAEEEDATETATSAPAPAAKEEAKPVEPAPVAKPLAETPKPAPTKTEPMEVTDAPVASVVKPAPAPKAEPVKPAPKAEPAKPTAGGGAYKIQLGAYGSDAEARQNWKKITGKHGDVVKGEPIVVKAEVNGKTYYRLRASGFASADAAKKACATLSGRGQACFPAGK